MFPLTALRRRLVCRALFLSLAVVPTLWVCSWALAWNLPSHGRSYQRALAVMIGHHVHFGEITHPCPGVTRLIDVDLKNAETGDTILTADILEADVDGEQITVAIDGVRCLRGGLPELLDLLSEQLSGRRETTSSGQSVGRVHVTPSQWTIVYDGIGASDAALVSDEARVSDGARAQTLDDVEIDLRLRDGVPWAQLQFLLPDRTGGDADADDARITIAWDRNRGITPPTTGVTINTGTSALPCGLLQAVFTDFDLLGSRATFCGTANLQLHAAGWHGSLEGTLDKVPLDRLLTGHSELLLSGEAEIVVTKAELHEGRLVQVGGTIRSAGGRISRALLESLAGCDGLSVKVPPAEHDKIHRYQNLACRVQPGPGGLSLTACEGAGAIMRAADGRILIMETDTTVQPLALAAALLPESDVMIPATPRAAAMMRWLPLPKAIADKPGGDRIATPQVSIKTARPHREAE
jgi:hypothetical protein